MYVPEKGGHALAKNEAPKKVTVTNYNFLKIIYKNRNYCCVSGGRPPQNSKMFVTSKLQESVTFSEAKVTNAPIFHIVKCLYCATYQTLDVTLFLHL